MRIFLLLAQIGSGLRIGVHLLLDGAQQGGRGCFCRHGRCDVDEYGDPDSNLSRSRAVERIGNEGGDALLCCKWLDKVPDLGEWSESVGENCKDSFIDDINDAIACARGEKENNNMACHHQLSNFTELIMDKLRANQDRFFHGTEVKKIDIAQAAEVMNHELLVNGMPFRKGSTGTHFFEHWQSMKLLWCGIDAHSRKIWKAILGAGELSRGNDTVFSQVVNEETVDQLRACSYTESEAIRKIWLVASASYAGVSSEKSLTIIVGKNMDELKTTMFWRAELHGLAQTPPMGNISVITLGKSPCRELMPELKHEIEQRSLAGFSAKDIWLKRTQMATSFTCKEASVDNPSAELGEIYLPPFWHRAVSVIKFTVAQVWHQGFRTVFELLDMGFSNAEIVAYGADKFKFSMEDWYKSSRDGFSCLEFLSVGGAIPDGIGIIGNVTYMKLEHFPFTNYEGTLLHAIGVGVSYCGTRNETYCFDAKLTERLLDVGADPNARDANGSTPLCILAKMGQQRQKVGQRREPTESLSLAFCQRYEGIWKMLTQHAGDPSIACEHDKDATSMHKDILFECEPLLRPSNFWADLYNKGGGTVAGTWHPRYICFFEAIKELGHQVSMNPDEPAQICSMVGNQLPSEVGDDEVREISKYCKALTTIDLSSTQITDNAISKVVGNCADLEEISFHETLVTSAGVKDIAIGCPRLQRVSLSERALSDPGLKEISRSLHDLIKITLHYDSGVSSVCLKGQEFYCKRVCRNEYSGLVVTSQCASDIVDTSCQGCEMACENDKVRVGGGALVADYKFSTHETWEAMNILSLKPPVCLHQAGVELQHCSAPDFDKAHVQGCEKCRPNQACDCKFSCKSGYMFTNPNFDALAPQQCLQIDRAGLGSLENCYTDSEDECLNSKDLAGVQCCWHPDGFLSSSSPAPLSPRCVSRGSLLMGKAPEQCALLTMEQWTDPQCKWTCGNDFKFGGPGLIYDAGVCDNCVQGQPCACKINCDKDNSYERYGGGPEGDRRCLDGAEKLGAAPLCAPRPANPFCKLLPDVQLNMEDCEGKYAEDESCNVACQTGFKPKDPMKGKAVRCKNLPKQIESGYQAQRDRDPDVLYRLMSCSRASSHDECLSSVGKDSAPCCYRAKSFESGAQCEEKGSEAISVSKPPDNSECAQMFAGYYDREELPKCDPVVPSSVSSNGETSWGPRTRAVGRRLGQQGVRNYGRGHYGPNIGYYVPPGHRYRPELRQPKGKGPRYRPELRQPNGKVKTFTPYEAAARPALQSIRTKAVPPGLSFQHARRGTGVLAAGAAGLTHNFMTRDYSLIEVNTGGESPGWVASTKDTASNEVTGRLLTPTEVAELGLESIEGKDFGGPANPCALWQPWTWWNCVIHTSEEELENQGELPAAILAGICSDSRSGCNAESCGSALLKRFCAQTCGVAPCTAVNLSVKEADEE